MLQKGSDDSGGEVDPCLFVSKSSKGTVFTLFYVGDNYVIGDTAAINEAIQAKWLCLED